MTGLCSGRQCSDRALCSATLAVQDEGRERGLSCSAGRPSRGCLAQLVGDLGMHKGLVGEERGRRDSAYQGLEGPRMSVSSHGIKTAMSQSCNKPRSMHEAPKLDNLSKFFFFPEDGLASGAKRTNGER